MDKDRIKVKIKKLLALGNSPNENEAAIALEKAQKLLRQYEMSLEDVLDVTEDNVREVYVHEGSSRIPMWIGWLGTTIASAFNVGCYRKYVWNPGLRRYQPAIVLVGFEVDLEIAHHCFIFLRGAIECNYRSKRQEMKARGRRSFPRNFKNSYAWGYLTAVREKLEALARVNDTKNGNDTNSGNLPVLKQNAITRYMERLNLKRTGRSVRLDSTGYFTGLFHRRKIS